MAFINHKSDFDIAIIGGGIVGLATAYKIALNRPQLRLAVLEKEPKLAGHQTGHNSGVIHSGLYYKPGSAKAKTCTDGRKQLVAFARQYGIPYEICGKIIVVTHPKELPGLERIYNNGVQNGIEGIQKITPEQIKQIEPYCTGIAGLKIPCTGIIDFVAVANKLAELMQKQNPENRILTSHKAIAFDKQPGCTKILTNQATVSTRFVINCAGLQSDRLARLDGVRIKMRIVPFRGDYYNLKKEAWGKVKNLIYPVPDPQFPFLGVHFTREIKGGIECGPNAVFSFKREGYGKLDFNLRDAWESLTYLGTLKLFMKNWRYGLGEYVRAFSKTLFVRQLQRLVPSIQKANLTPGNSGVRAQAVGADGKPIDDFVIEAHGSSIHVLNAPSPAATACLAIADHINKLAAEQFKL
ncbi:MAG: L-2-hydroxyglutarate oxidase [Sedimentisphaerales bacterium]|nr:L-2-hydroxyglutarate oxidase [Sedimentisphaerales bacterium]